ncbi:MAG: hypothetical protein ACP5ID_04575 [Conexivisphaera sp.]
MRIDPVRELAEAVRAMGVFGRNKPLSRRRRAALLRVAGLSSWEMAEELGRTARIGARLNQGCLVHARIGSSEGEEVVAVDGIELEASVDDAR